MAEKTERIVDLIDDIKYELKNDPELEMMVREGLGLIIAKIKDQKKWKTKK